MPVRLLVSSLAVLMLVTGCARTPRGYVAREWSSTMRELGIIPVFPPREDVYVGDVYVSPVSPDGEHRALKKKEFLPLGLWVTSLDISNEISQFYAHRPSFPTTPSATVDFMKQQTNNPFAALAQAQDTNRNVFLGGDRSRLRMVGFPSFMSATFNKGDLAAVVPVEAVNLAFGAGFTSSRSVTVSVPVAESCAIPADRVWPRIMNAEGKLMDFIPGVPLSQLHNLVNAKQVVRSGEGLFAPLRIITEVYYTRALDISVATEDTRGLGLAGKPLATDVVATVAGAAGAAGGNRGGASGTNTPASTNAVFIMGGVTNLTGNAVERAAEMNRSLEQAMTQTVPGGSVKFVAAGDRAVAMRRTYDRPIAIGYRAIQVLVPISPPEGSALAFGGGVQGFSPTGSGPSVISPSSGEDGGVTPPPPLDDPGEAEEPLVPGRPIPPEPAR